MVAAQHLANLPLEHLGAARDQAVSRVPSLSLLHHLLKTHVGDRSAQGKKPSVMQRGVDPASVFYVLNPDGDLSGTEQILKPHFDRWVGGTLGAALWCGWVGAILYKVGGCHTLIGEWVWVGATLY